MLSDDMKIMKKRVLFACIAMLTALVTTQIAYACDCIGPPTAALQLERSTIAGIFKLQSIETVSGPDNPRIVYRPKFTVEKVFKGPLKVGEDFILSPPRTNCDWYFSDKDEGVSFLLYIRANPADSTDLRVWICSRSGPVSRSKTELKELEKITRPGRRKHYKADT